MNPQTLAWIGAFAAAAAMVWFWHVRGRAPLTWDEAARVDSGYGFVYALRSLSLAQLWDWFNAQTYYPFLLPSVHGLVLAAGGSVLTAAWLPTAAGYGLVGVLAGRLAKSLGAGTAGAWSAALLTWLSPMNVRLAPGAFTENLGACALMALLLAIIRLEERQRIRDSVCVAAVVVVSWLVKYDYGILACGILGLSAVRAIARHGFSTAMRLYGPAADSALLAVGLLVLSFLRFSDDRGRSILSFVSQPGIERRIDFLHYPRTLLTSSEVALAPIVAVLLLFGVAWGAVSWRRRADLQVPLLAVAAWLVLYSLAAAKQPRFVAVLIPVLACLAVVAVADIKSHPMHLPRASILALSTVSFGVLVAPSWTLALALLPIVAIATGIALKDRRTAPLAWLDHRVPRWAAVSVLTVVVGVQFAPQLAALRNPLWLLKSNQPAAEALAFTAERLPDRSTRPVLMIGPSNAFSMRLLHLAWSDRIKRQSPGVEMVPEAPSQDRRLALLDAIARFSPERIVVVDAGFGSRFDIDKSARGEDLFPSQRKYAALVPDLAETDGTLSLVDSFSPEFEPVRVQIWEVRPSALTGRLVARAEPSLPASISVDGVARDRFAVDIRLPVGHHEVCFGWLPDQEPPPCQVVTIEPGAVTSVVGRYEPRPGAPADTQPEGYLDVDTDPPVPSEISVDGVLRNTSALNLLGVAPGVHLVCFGYVPGFETPPCQESEVSEGATTSVIAGFRERDFQPIRG